MPDIGHHDEASTDSIVEATGIRRLRLDEEEAERFLLDETLPIARTIVSVFKRINILPIRKPDRYEGLKSELEQHHEEKDELPILFRVMEVIDEMSAAAEDAQQGVEAIQAALEPDVFIGGHQGLMKELDVISGALLACGVALDDALTRMKAGGRLA